MRNAQPTKVWFITGASRGFGRQLTAVVLAAGDSVVATARDTSSVSDAHPGAGERLLAIPLDVTDEEQSRHAVEQAVDRFGRIDVLVNNAGFGLFGAVEEVPDQQARELFDTNVFGMLNVTRSVLPVLRRQGDGHVFLMGSSAGFAAGAGRGLYGASKFAVEGLSEALWDELSPLGIKVTLIEPGSFRTEFLSGNSRSAPNESIPAYAGTVGALQTAFARNDGRQPGDPQKAAEVIARVASMPEPPFRLQLWSDSVSLVENKLASVRDELTRWRELAVSTDFGNEGAANPKT